MVYKTKCNVLRKEKFSKVTLPCRDFDALTHVLKSSLGTGILAMPVAFRGSGLILGMFTTIIVSVICCHGAYIVVSFSTTVLETVP